MNVFQLFITHNVGGVSEPVLYGIGMKYKKTLIALAVGGICGGLFAAFTDVVYYLGPSFPLIGNALSFFQGGTKNFILFFIGLFFNNQTLCFNQCHNSPNQRIYSK